MYVIEFFRVFCTHFLHKMSVIQVYLWFAYMVMVGACVAILFSKMNSILNLSDFVRKIIHTSQLNVHCTCTCVENVIFLN